MRHLASFRLFSLMTLIYLLISLSTSVFGQTSPSPSSSPSPPSAVKIPISIHVDQSFNINFAGICSKASSEQLAQLNLRINGLLTPLKALDCNPAEGEYGLYYFLPQTDGADMDKLREVLSGSPWRDAKHGFQRDLAYTVSFNDGSGERVIASGKLRYQIVQVPYLLLGFAFIALATVVLLRLGRASALLRDMPPGETKIPVQSRTFSMARVQMAWWFLIVLISYVWLWIVSEGIPGLSTGALGLMGIGSATYLAAAGVDASKQNELFESHGFWNDILSDAQGLTLYRFQLLVFNALFGILFLIYVVQNVVMPDFDSHILTLLGMSAGTYAGFKIPEKQTGSSASVTPPSNGA